MTADGLTTLRRFASRAARLAPACPSWEELPAMSDLFDEFFNAEPIDPVEAARRGGKRTLRQRFYTRAEVAARDGAFAVLLDARALMTPGRRALAAPTAPLAEAIAREWNARGEFIDPLRMPITRLANSIIDGVVDAPAEVAADVVKYLGSDLVCYRAEAPDGLVAAQAQSWDPLLDWARVELGVGLVTARGVMFVTQAPSAVAAAAAAIPKDPWRLGALHAATTLTGSALIALALAHGRLSEAGAWAAAHVDEDWNMALWGRDETALERRARRFAELEAAAAVLRLAC
jgi:chaperone required for assembly of F1-ATPase